MIRRNLVSNKNINKILFFSASDTKINFMFDNMILREEITIDT